MAETAASRAEVELEVARKIHASHLGTRGTTCLLCRLDARIAVSTVLSLLAAAN